MKKKSKSLTVLCLACFSLTSCTISFQNISTHGTAEDLVDDTMDTSPNISPDISVPISTVPALPAIP